jgi:hypothetical protein
MKLVDIEFKKHDPNKVVGNHMESCGLKIYEHEDSPHDEMFRGAKSYSEVLSRVRALPPEGMIEFYKFQEHRKEWPPQSFTGESLYIPRYTTNRNQRFNSYKLWKTRDSGDCRRN